MLLQLQINVEVIQKRFLRSFPQLQMLTELLTPSVSSFFFFLFLKTIFPNDPFKLPLISEPVFKNNKKYVHQHSQPFIPSTSALQNSPYEYKIAKILLSSLLSTDYYHKNFYTYPQERTVRRSE